MWPHAVVAEWGEILGYLRRPQRQTEEQFEYLVLNSMFPKVPALGTLVRALDSVVAFLTPLPPSQNDFSAHEPHLSFSALPYLPISPARERAPALSFCCLVFP